MINDSQLDEWQRLADATPGGVWVAIEATSKTNSGIENGETWTDKAGRTRETVVLDMGCGCCAGNDSSKTVLPFAAAARSAVPALIAEVRRLRAELDKRFGVTALGVHEITSGDLT